MSRTSIVVDLHFGDSGKGVTTNHLVKEALARGEKPLVVRFSGGPQAGHHVLDNGKSHVFSHWGAGTLQGAPTFWSKYCYTEPGAFVKEWEKLKELNIAIPPFYIDPMSPVITPLDRFHNRNDHENKRHGTCGMGIGMAAKRTEESPHKLYVKDLFAPEWILIERMRSVCQYHNYPDVRSQQLVKEVELFYEYVKQFKEIAIPVGEDYIYMYPHIIFEGSQGILLDRDHGFFPHVTRAHTTSRNAMEIIERNGLNNKYRPTVYYVTRPYLTRHGNGPIPSTGEIEVINTENEINVTNEYQGEFRIERFNDQLFNYALSCDPYWGKVNPVFSITGMDRMLPVFKWTDAKGDWMLGTHEDFLKKFLGLGNVIYSSNYQFYEYE